MSRASGRIEGVLFDFGSTLFAHAPLDVTIARCAAQLDRPIDENGARYLADRIAVASMSPAELAHRRDLDADVWRERWEALYSIADSWAAGLGAEVYRAMHDPLAWSPYQRAAETLRSLHSHDVSVGIVSNTGWDVRAAFVAHEMNAAVSTYTLSCEVGAVKPDRRIFDIACASLGLGGDQVIMVGDDPRADSGAVLAGVRTFLLPASPPQADNGIASVLDLVGVGGSS
jgi:FMN phosphatase YigB (HAD superfamily)